MRYRRSCRRRARTAAATLLLGILAGCDRSEPQPAAEPPPPGTVESAAARPSGVPVLIVGIDAADWDLLRPLARRGELPAFADLMARGATAVLRGEEPLLSPILWTTLATGRGPLEHGILDFVEVDPEGGGAMPVSARQRRVPALWDLFSAAGLDATVVAWWGSWPAYPLRGRIVSDRVAYTLFPVEQGPDETAGLFYPAELRERLAPLQVEAGAVDREMLGDLADVDDERLRRADEALAAGASPFDDPLNHLRSVLAATLSYHHMALALLEEHQSALFAVYYQGVDEVNHRFAHCRAPALSSCPPQEARAFGGSVDAFYRLQDHLLAELLQRVRDDTAVVVVSDHGFLSGDRRPQRESARIGIDRASAWHHPAGVFLLAGPPARAGELPALRLRDVAPTVLYLAGLPLSEELEGRPALAAIEPAFQQAHPAIEIAAYTPWEGLAAAARAGGEADRRALEKLEALGYLAAGATSVAPAGEAATRAVVRRLSNEAGLRSRAGEVDEARRLLRRAIDLDPGYVEARIGLAMGYLRDGRPQEALPHFRRLLPDAWDASPGVYPEAARCFLQTGQADEGLERFTALADEHPEVTPIRVGQAILLEGRGDADGARALLRQALRRDPTSPEAMATLLASLTAAGRPGEAIPFLQAALEVNPRSVPHHRWLGRLAEARGRYPEAVLHYMKASDAAPGEYGPLDDLGRATALAGRTQEAARIFESASRTFADDPRPPFNLGVVRERAGDPEGAHRAFLEAERRGMRTAEIYRRAGRAASAAGQTAEARRLYRRSLELEPDQPELLRALEEMAGG